MLPSHEKKVDLCVFVAANFLTCFNFMKILITVTYLF